MDDAIPANVMSLSGGVWFFLWRGEAAKITEYTEYRKWMTPYRKCDVTARGRVVFCGEEKQRKVRSTRSTENGDVAGRRTTP